jgi:hypothetical protein
MILSIENCKKSLNIDLQEDLTPELLRKYYRINALKYHPDKNRDDNARDKFEEIKQAYEYLNKHIEWIEFDESDDDTRDDYESLLFIFVKNVVQKSCDVLQNKLYNTIIKKISTVCEEKAIQLIQNIDKNVLIKTYEILLLYRESFHLSDYLFQRMEEILQQKMCNDECIILNPLIDDLLEHNVYKLKIEENMYLIPLWHHELIYDNSGADLYVRCNPILPENMSIDEDNNLTVTIHCKIADIFEKSFLEVSIGKRKHILSISHLTLKRVQTMIIKHKGIPRINTKDIYNISDIGEIRIDIELEL